jgi:hypothetical protein
VASIDDVWRAYEKARGQWRGCNWPTHYGLLDLDLDGISSDQAHQEAKRWRALTADETATDDLTSREETSLVDMARHLRLRGAVTYVADEHEWRPEVRGPAARSRCGEALATQWESAASWLEEIESDARWADEEALEAVQAAEDADWGQALGHAEQACLIESGYYAPRGWTRLKREIERAAR